MTVSQDTLAGDDRSCNLHECSVRHTLQIGSPHGCAHVSAPQKHRDSSQLLLEERYGFHVCRDLKPRGFI
jgi:hypothetical protein